MEAKKQFFTECHLAGRQYYDVDEVWDELHIGTHLKLEREPDNHFDKNAIQIIYERESDKECFMLGYIPRTENSTISKLIDAGWDKIFDCRISKKTAEAQYEEQIRMTIRINKNK